MLRLLFAALALVTPVSAAECTLRNAYYQQVDGSWTLSFRPVPRSAAANQTAAFIMDLPNSSLMLVGSLYRPNGYGSALYALEGPCSAENTDTCHFLGDTLAPVYANTDSGIVEIDDSEGALAPRQILLTSLGATLWYSSYRQDEFFDDYRPSDVFNLVSCD